MTLKKVRRSKVESITADLELLEEAMAIVGTEHTGYFLKSLKALTNERDLYKSRSEQLIEALNTNSFSNAVSKATTLCRNEPAPPSEAELAYEAEQAAKYERRLSKARTIDVLDSILFAISNWSDDGLVAGDLELAMKSVVFPSVIERLMAGDARYAIDEFPESAIEIVRQGRELIRKTRAEFDFHVSCQKNWDLVAPKIQEWVRTEMLHLLYGATDDAWVTDQPLTFEQMRTWHDKHASRALDLPIVFDAYELRNALTAEDRGEIGMAAFMNEQLATRLDTQQLSVV